MFKGIPMAFSADDFPNRFDFKAAQPRIYEMWQERGLFHAEPDPSRKPFSIVIPPPNVTGALHLGHALNNTLQDILIRMKRMQGYNALWMPGTDHAGIATQAVVERRLKEEEGKTRHDLGREALVKRIWDWKEQYEKRILGQLKQMGSSCDWERTRFTLDETCARAVRHFFFDLFQKEWVYRGKRLVNWDTSLQTAVSDDEVFSKKVNGNFWHIRYPIVDPQEGEPTHLIVATTRPETMLGDTAVAVHPDPEKALDKVEAELRDKLSKAKESEREAVQKQINDLQTRRAEQLPELIKLRDMAADGRRIMLPLMNREIPLVTDGWAKPELGSGCVKITPAHDPNDYEVGKRCNLEMLNVMNPDGTMNAEAGKYQGMVLKEARKQVVADLEAIDLLADTEAREIELPHSDRSKSPIEPLLADQWFVRMETLAQTAMDAVSEGEVKIFPERYAGGYLDWLGEKRDWPISRQLWWGHRIPVWSQPVDSDEACKAMVDRVTALADFDSNRAAIQIEPSPESDPKKRELLELPFATVHVCVLDQGDPLENALNELGFEQADDVLDTWFSSALWPHSTLGWPEKTKELESFYPTSTLITSRDIITLWVARMVLAGINNMGTVPFREVYIHPKILDGYGETMSKSKGNGIDPLDVIEKFGSDALRFGMAHLTTETQDVRMPVQFECPHCESAINQTKKNRQLPRIECSKCNQPFSTQWAETEEDQKLPRGPIISERFEVARNFGNKLWNASRFAFLNLEGYTPGSIADDDLRTEDRWILSRLATVTKKVTGDLERYHFSDAARTLYDFAWDEFCSFYVEMLKDRFADEAQKPVAQRLLAHTLDSLLRLLHPIIPFITEDIWQILQKVAPQRGLPDPQPASECLIGADWPTVDASHIDTDIEAQFARFQKGLAALREIRARQNIGPKKSVELVIRCSDEVRDSLQPMAGYFSSMANSNVREIGAEVAVPKINAPLALPEMELFVDLAGLIDVEAETKRLEKERSRIEGMIGGKEKKLSNASFVDRAPADVVEREREGLAQLKEQLAVISEALNELAKQK